jgi:hypothetical protein
MAAPRPRGTREAVSSSDDDADILARAQRLPASSQVANTIHVRRRTTQLHSQAPLNMPQAGGTSSDSDADLLRRAQQQKTRPVAQARQTPATQPTETLIPL